MRNWVILLFTFFTLSSLAQVRTPYFIYEKKKIKLDDKSFTRYIIPQLKALTQEFYHILKKYHSLHESTIKLYLQVSEIERAFKIFDKNCKQMDNDCLDQLKSLYEKARVLDKLILNPLHNQLRLFQNFSSSELEAVIQLIGSLEQISNQNYRLMHALEEYILTANTTFFLFFDGKTLIQPTIHEMLLSSELMMTQLLEGKMKEDFHAVWIHFFREVDQKLIYEQDKIYLLKRLEELNLAWNTFHMKMTKGNHDVPSNIVSLIKIMHNRWNSCLKIILR